MTVVEISECFPNKLKPVTGEFIYQHVKALSKYCNVVTLVPVRYIPPREILTLNPLKFLSDLKDWYSSLNDTKSFTEINLKVIYFGYISLPRPYFEKADISFLNFFFYNKIFSLLKEINPDLICCHWLRPWSELTSKIASGLKVPFVIDHHEDIPTLKKLYPENYKTFLNSFRNADRIIVHSSLNKSELESELPYLRNISICYLGQSLSVIKKEKTFSENTTRLICVSHLSERRKNIEVLINSFHDLSKTGDYELTIAGDGILKNEYIELTGKLNLTDKIKFAGLKSQKEIEDLLDHSDIFILPSYPEAFGIVLIEAMARGLPLITCEGNGGGVELKKLGYPVILIKPGSAEDLSKAISGLSGDKIKMQEMSLSGIQIVIKYFTNEINAQNTYSIYSEVINKFNTNN